MIDSKLKFVFFFVLWFSFSFAQKIQTKESSWNAKIDMLQLVDVASFPTLKLTVEKKITPKFAVLLGGGFQLYEPYPNNDTIQMKATGFKIDMEARTYILKVLNPQRYTQSGGIFVGIQGLYRENKFAGGADYKRKNDDPNAAVPTFSDEFGVKKKIFGANITSGWQKSLRRFVFEPSVGLGIMNRKITNTEMAFNSATDRFHYNHGNGIPRTENKSGNYFNLSLSFKIGYQF